MMRFRLMVRLSSLLLLLVVLSAPGLSDAQPLSVYVVEFASPGGSGEAEWLGPFIADSIENNLKYLPGVELAHVKRPGSSADGSDVFGPDALRSSPISEAMGRSSRSRSISCRPKR
jgi:hypothetical protein